MNIDKLLEQAELQEAILGGTVIMLRNDGEYFICQSMHPIVMPVEDYEDFEYRQESGYNDYKWYYDHTNHQDLKDRLKILMTDIWKSYPQSEVVDLHNEIANECSNEFVKVRTSGKYRFGDSDDVKDIYFRVASADFNWFPIIWQFVADNVQNSLYINIVRDEELTGEEYYYRDGKNIFKHMSVEEFITLKGNPIIESEDTKVRKLQQGYSIRESYGVGNYYNIDAWFNIRKKKEIKERYVRG